jgi:branched-chain amino acid aminotransferase
LNNALGLLDYFSPHLNPPPAAAGGGREGGKNAPAFFDVLFLDESGFVTESSIWNVFIVKNGILFTPAQGVLHGVTRQFVIECAQEESFQVQESNTMRHDFWNADEAFLTNTSGELVPIRSLDGRKIGDQIPGKITKQLTAKFHQKVEQEISNEN